MTWLYQWYSSNSGWVDVAWAYSLAAVAVYCGLMGNGGFITRLVLSVCGFVWFFRLGTHLLLRVAVEPEDGRYQALRTYLGRHQQSGLFIFFQVQALLIWVLSWPFLIVAESRFNVYTTALTLFLITFAFIGESLADAQLAAFRKDPKNKGKSCRIGLWKYSRHPNYFFEWIYWLSFPILAFQHEYFFITACAPIIMWVFLNHLTGIPFSEQQALRSRGQDYKDYQMTTSKFFPWFSKAKVS